MTAVEWLIEQISSSKYFYNLMEEIQSRSTIAGPNGILHQAKEMEKVQMGDTWDNGMKSDNGHFGTFEQYYNETFKKD